jgi:hypothetical protein
MLIKETSALYGIIAEYETPEALLAAAEKARDAGYKKMDAFAPFPVEGLSHALGFKDKYIPIIMLFAGLFGITWGLGLQVFSNALSYPLNIGGRPMWSWPNFIPITFEATVLTCAWTGGIMMFAINGLPAPYHPVFDAPNFDRASTDRFFLCIEAKDKNFDVTGTRKLLEETAPVQVSEINVER